MNSSFFITNCLLCFLSCTLSYPCKHAGRKVSDCFSSFVVGQTFDMPCEIITI